MRITEEENSLISVIIPAYQVNNDLERCIQSVCRQSYSNLEIILVLNGSAVYQKEDVLSFANNDERIKILETRNNGVANARNIGVKVATGEYIGFVDADDWIEPTMYETLIVVAHRDHTKIVICDYYFESEKPRISEKINDGILTCDEALEELCSNRLESFTWNKLFAREVFRNVFFPEVAIFEDVAVMHHLFTQCDRISLVGKQEYHYVRHTGSLTSRRKKADWVDALEILRERIEFLRNDYPSLMQAVGINVYTTYVTLSVSGIKDSGSPQDREKLKELTDYYRRSEKELFFGLSNNQRFALKLFWKGNRLCYLTGLSLEALCRIKRRIH